MANKTIIKKIEKIEKIEAENLIKVLDRITKERLIIDANKEKDYKTKYLHISWNEFIN